MSEALGFVLVVTAILGVGIGLGMLVAPRLTRLAERDEEEPSDDERG
jgi:hypothetical protein